mgnify:CR=1 FL=1
MEGNGDNSIVTEHIRRLRGKIAQKTKEDYIETVWGVGYEMDWVDGKNGNVSDMDSEPSDLKRR